jgi:CubicO group peptidase (beta-lactamase class C family)
MLDQSLALNRRSLLGSGLLLAAMPLPVLGQSITRQDPLIAAVLALFEPADGAAARAIFHAQMFSAAGQTRWPLARFEQIMGEIAALSGGFDFVAADRQGTTVWLTLRSRHQQVERTLRVRLDRDNPARVFDLPSLPAPAPYPRPLPQGPLAAADLPALVDNRIAFAAQRDEFSGVCRIVDPTGAMAYEAAAGMASRAPDRPNAADFRFHLGSADKSFTALLVARLVEEGRLTFETTLAEVLPDYPNADFARACTMRHLLCHASGLGSLFDRPGYDKTEPYSRMADLLPAFAAELPAFAPGTAAAYSNEGFVVLGAVIEQVTGESWYDWLDRHIYRPAGMVSSGHFLGQQLPDRVATGYRYPDTDHWGIGPRQSNRDFLGYRGNSCGGGFATVADMTAYLNALRSGRIVPRTAVETLLTRQPDGIADYGLGFIVKPLEPGRTLVGHGGGGPHSGIGGMGGIIWETGWAFSVLGNYDAHFTGPVADDIAALLARMS